MIRLRRVSLAIAILAAVTVTGAAGPRLLTAASEAYQRIEVLSRMFDIIEMYYVDEVDGDDMFRVAVNGMLENLDPHSRYYTAEEYRELQERYRGDYYGIGISFDIFDGVLTVLDALEGGPSEALGLRPGDQIVEIEGENAVGFDTDQVYERLRGPKGTRVSVRVRRPGIDGLLPFTITRDQVPVPAIRVATMLDGGTGFIWLDTFSQKAADQIEARLQEFERQGMTSLVRDLRGNRGGLMNQAIRIVDKFIAGGKKIVYTVGRTPNANSETRSTDRDTHGRFPIIVIVDHNSASASEIVAGALQDWDRGLVVGQTTFGKALVQNQFPFADGSALFLTIARYFTPSGRMIQRPYDGPNGDEYYNPDWESIDGVTDEYDPLAVHEQGSEHAVEPGERPIFHTAAGREVFGGGGVTPDYEIEPTRVSRLAATLYFRRLGFQFATRFVTEGAAEIPASLGDFRARFNVTDSSIDEFIEFVRAAGFAEQLEEMELALDEESIAAAREDIRKYLKADIAANIWGQEAGRIVLLDYDGTVIEALNLVPRAVDLLSLVGRRPA